MAINSGVGPHAAWLSVSGAMLPIEHGSATLNATRRSGSFNGIIPLSYPGAAETLANIGDNQAQIITMTRGQTQPLITGELDDAEFDLIGRTIRFSGRDNSAKLHNIKSSEKWQNLKGSDIVSQLIGRIGLSGNIAASAIMAGKQLQQDFVRLADNVSYGYVIHKLSQVDGMRWFFDAQGTFHYLPFSAPTGIYSITVNQQVQPISADCHELRVRRNIQAGKGVAATVSSWHPKKKKVFTYTSNVAGNGGPINYSYTVPGLEQDHVTKRAQSQAAEKARNEYTVTSTVVGDPSVTAAMGLQLNGTTYFDQVFDIDTVQHDYGMSGHFTHIVARSAKQGRQAS